MKAEDLMIGDWVNLYDNPIKINIDDLGVIDRDETYDKGVHCKPIQLTEEILEKNDFELFSSYPYVSYVYYFDNVEESSIFIIFPEKDEYNEEIVFNYYRNDDDKLIDNLPLKFVHQLQHALKLCGIEKEIIL